MSLYADLVLLYCRIVYLLFTILLHYFFFFFKQKTAYEMRISDWSSDVCSSDLWSAAHRCCETRPLRPSFPVPPTAQTFRSRGRHRRRSGRRSEEHTSELQSLMSISYAVFCWQKKISPPIIMLLAI